MMKLIDALPLDEKSQWAFVGSGGKSSTIFSLANQYKKTIIVSTTTHISLKQAKSGDHHWEIEDELLFPQIVPVGIIVVTQKSENNEKAKGLSEKQIDQLSEYAIKNKIPLLIEADGSRLKPLKAPADYEPVIPKFVNRVVVVAGMKGIGRPLNEKFVHRPEIFSEISKIEINQSVNQNGLISVLVHENGGKKNIPNDILTTLILTQVDSIERKLAASQIAKKAALDFNQVAIVNIGKYPEVIHLQQPIAGIILAAGESKRLGRPKQLLNWRRKPFIQVIAENAIAAGLSPIIVVTGKLHKEISDILSGYPVEILQNLKWKNGQGSSVALAAKNLSEDVGGAVFLLSDQPQIQFPLLKTLIETHSNTVSKIVAPLIDGQRGNPVLFDSSTFMDLSQLSGEKGGKQLFSKFPVEWVPWIDAGALLDVDTEDDYQKLLQRYK